MAMSSFPDRSRDEANDDGRPSRTGLGSVVILSVVVAMLTGIVAGGLTAWLIMSNAQSEPIRVTQTPQITYVEEPEASAVAVYQAVAPSVVTVLVLDEDRPSGFGTGTGIIVDGQGHILTNNHVVSEAERVRVQLLDGSTLFAKVVGSDPGTDLAIIQADFPPGTLQIARFGDSGAVKPGDPVFAIGAPYGFSHSITAGIVSAVGKDIPRKGTPTQAASYRATPRLIPAIPVGPLLNVNGEVIGITTAIQTTNQRFQGVGFSIPSNLVQQLLPQLIKGEKIRRAFLGVSMDTLTPQQARASNLDIEHGVWIRGVVPGGPAQEAGIRGSRRSLRSADIITAIDGVSMKTADDLIAYVQTKDVGDAITITVYRNGDTLEFTATLGAWPEN